MSEQTSDALSGVEHLGAQQLRIVALLAEAGAHVRLDGDGAVVVRERGGVSIAGLRFPGAALHGLAAEGLLRDASGGQGARYVLSAEGRSAALRLRQGARPSDFSVDRMKLCLRPGDGGETALLVNEAESPLLWLRRRKGRTGEGLIGDAEFAAGERLRADVTRAKMLPSLSVDWSRPTNQGSFNPTGLNASESAIAARQRVEAALEATGPEFAGLLIDVCGFLKPIELVERERGWPARSAKVVLCLGLRRLARHYGYDRAVGIKKAPGLRSWRDGAARSRFPEAGQST